MSTFILVYDAIACIRVPVEASSPEEAFRLWRLNQAGATREVTLEIPPDSDVLVCDNKGTRVTSIPLPDPEPDMTEWAGFRVCNEATLVESGFGQVQQTEEPHIQERGLFNLVRTLDWILGITSCQRKKTLSAFLQRPQPRQVAPWAPGVDRLVWPQPPRRSRVSRALSWLAALFNRKGGNRPC